MDEREYEKKQKVESWKRLGRMVFAIMGLVVLLAFIYSYMSEEDKIEKSYNMDPEEKEMLEDMNRQ
jgi:Tfp pilus assembly protein PilO